jgi:hypothetical protein
MEAKAVPEPEADWTQAGRELNGPFHGREFTMCDYSLMSFPNRLAVEGENLVVHRFSSGSMGLASPDELKKAKDAAAKRSFWAVVKDWLVLAPGAPVTAVCIPPASHLMMHDIPQRFQKEYALQPEEEVIFRQLSAEPNEYRDALQFRNGRVIRLQELSAGQQVTVLDSGSPQPCEGDLTELPAMVELLDSRGR